MDQRLIDRFGKKQHGLITREQWVAAGGSRSAWFRALDSDRLVAVHPGVARLPGVPSTAAQPILAAVLGSRAPLAVASHTSAASLYGAEVRGVNPTHVTVPVDGPRPNLAGVVLHRPSDRRALRPALVQRVPTTRPTRTLLDCGAVLRPSELGVVVEHLLIRQLTSLAAIEQALVDHGRAGRRGIGPVRDLLARYACWAKPPDSVLEVAFRELVHAAGLPAPEFHRIARVGGRTMELDFAYVGGRLPIDVEVDGWASHGHPHAFDDNRERDAILQAVGWVVQRFTWFQVVERPAFVIGVLTGLFIQHGYLPAPA